MKKKVAKNKKDVSEMSRTEEIKHYIGILAKNLTDSLSILTDKIQVEYLKRNNGKNKL